MHGVYIIHFEPAYRHARHYVGYADDIERRMDEHERGIGARLTQVAREAGIELILTRIWEGEGRDFERRLKRRKNTPRYCPLCRKRVK